MKELLAHVERIRVTLTLKDGRTFISQQPMHVFDNPSDRMEPAAIKGIVWEEAMRTVRAALAHPSAPGDVMSVEAFIGTMRMIAEGSAEAWWVVAQQNKQGMSPALMAGGTVLDLTANLLNELIEGAYRETNEPITVYMLPAAAAKLDAQPVPDCIDEQLGLQTMMMGNQPVHVLLQKPPDA